MDNKTLLIVDDEEDMRDILVKSLSQFVDKIYEAHDGEMGLKMVEKFNPTVIISDFKMPNLNGLEFMWELKKKSFIHQLSF